MIMTQGRVTVTLGCSDCFSECLAMPLLAEKCSCDRDGLPSLQVAGQQGAYVARMINRGYVPRPRRPNGSIPMPEGRHLCTFPGAQFAFCSPYKLLCNEATW